MSLQPFAISPYFDDFDEKKKFLEILFKPGLPVQVRELNQLQSILQNQLERFGNNIYTNGSMIVPGHLTFNANYSYVQLAALTDDKFAAVNPNDPSNVGVTLSLVNSAGVSANIVNATRALGNDPDTIFVSYLSSGTSIDGTNGTALSFKSGDDLTSINTNTIVATVATVPSLGVTSVVGTGSAVSIDTGVFYVNGYFVLCDAQTLILDKYTNQSSYSIGLTVVENIITVNQDSSLYDNASGTTNFLAPGADRYQIVLTLSKQIIGAVTPATVYFELMTVVSGIVQNKTDNTQYNVIEQQIDERTYETNGNFTINPFKIDIRENLLSDQTPAGLYTLSQGGDSTKLAVGLEPSTAYVDGVRIQTISTDFVNVNKARSTKQVNNSLTATPEASYIFVDRLFSFPTYDKAPEVFFYDSPIASDGVQPGGNLVGMATVMGVEYVSGNITNETTTFPYAMYKVYLTGVNIPNNLATSMYVANSTSGAVSCTANVVLQMNVRNTNGVISPGDTFTLGSVTHKVVSFDSANSVIYVEATGPARFTTGQTIVSNVGTSCTFASYTTLVIPDALYQIYPLDRTGISTIRNSDGIADTSYYIRRTQSASTNGTSVSFNANPNEEFISYSKLNYMASLDDTGEILNLDTANVTLSNGDTTITFTIPSGNHVVKLSATIFKSASEKIKTLTTTTLTTSVANSINLGQYDIYELVSITEVPVSGLQQDITSRYVLDNGQRPNRYSTGSITLGANQLAPANTSTLKITFSYFARSSNGDYYTVDSYVNFDGTAEWYENIPVFTSGSTSFNLRDCFDFRPDIDDTYAVGTSSINFLDFGQSIIADYQYYLGRIDKIYLDSTGNFNVIQGLPADNPVAPPDPSDGMVLYILQLNPYTFSTSDVVVTFIDNKRYTFRDIGKLEQRIATLEYYTSLNLLEQETANLVITDSATGLSLFKNGFIVDPFIGTNIADTANGDYGASIDPNNQICRPIYDINNVPLVIQENFSSGYKLHQPATPGAVDTITPDNNLVTIACNTPVYLEQPFITGSENLNPFGIKPFIGNILLEPSSDYWYDDVDRPTLVYNKNNMFDGVNNINNPSRSMNTIWNGWQTEWAGVPVNSTTEPTNPNSVTHVVDNSTIGIDYVPFLGKKLVKIQADGLKPNTRIYSYLDSIDVTQWVSSTVSNIGTGFNGNTPLGIGVIDPNWKITASSDPVNPGPNAYVVNPAIVAPNWSPNNSISQWISPNPTGIVTANTSFTYTYTFNLTNFEPSTAILSIQIISDDNCSIKVNGVTIVSQIGGFLPGNTRNFVVDSGFVAGINTIQIIVTNITGPSGMLTQVNITALPKGLITNTINSLITNNLGQFSGYLYVNEEINVKAGRRLFQLTDNINSYTTYGSAYYNSAGILDDNQQDIVALSEPNIVANSGFNPPSQIFTVQNKPGGIFLATMILQFASIDPTAPITLQIRELSNGIPSSVIVPGSEVVLYPTDVPPPTPSTGIVNLVYVQPDITRIVFRTPIFLQNNTSYALTFITNSNQYTICTAIVGQTSIAGTLGAAYAVANMGAFFKPTNTTQWISNPSESIYCIMYYCLFSPSATVYFSNDSIPAYLPGFTPITILGSLPFQTSKGSSLLRIRFTRQDDLNLDTYSHGLSPGSQITISLPPSEYTSLYNGISAQYITPNITTSTSGTKTYTVVNVDNDWVTISIASVTATSSGLTGPTDSVQVTRNIPYDVLYPFINQLVPTGTSIVWSLETTSGQSAGGSQIAYNKDLSFASINVNENIVFSTPRLVACDINEQTFIPGTTVLDKKSLVLKAILSTSNPNISPVIDVTRCAALAISNRINNSSPSNTNIDGFDNTQELIVTGTDIAFSATDNSISWSTSNFSGYLPDRYIAISGSNITANNSAYPNLVRIVSINQTNKKMILDSANLVVGTRVAGDSVTIKYYSNYVSDFSASDCSNPAQYIEKSITLDTPANSLKVYFELLRPSAASVTVFYRTLPITSSATLDTQQYSQMSLAAGYSDNASITTFNDLVYEIDNVEVFSQAQVKIVYKSTDSTQVPQISTFRIVTLSE